MKMNLGDCAELYRLLEEGEEPSALGKLKPEEILVRWINYHLRKNGQDDKQVKNLGKDLINSHALPTSSTDLIKISAPSIAYLEMITPPKPAPSSPTPSPSVSQILSHQKTSLPEKRKF